MALSELQCRRLDEKLTAWPGGLTPQYLLHLQSPAGAADLAELIDAISVQKTELFRDEPQLAALRTHVLEPMVARMHRPLRVWSAGCASGEEVATLLVMLAEAGADPSSTVLGTDISETAIARARELCFSAEQFQRVPFGVRERWFLPAGGGRFTLVGHLKDRASFECHNLMDLPYPVAAEGQGFDLIVCRNVLIYFAPEPFDRVVTSLAGRLTPEGVLVLSAAEPLLRAPPTLRTMRFEQAFFYARAQGAVAFTEAAPPGAPSTPSSSGLPSVGALLASRSATSGRFPALPAPLKPGTPAEVRPGDTLVVPATHGGVRDGCWDAQSPEPVTDLGTLAWLKKRKPILRAHPLVLEQLAAKGEMPRQAPELPAGDDDDLKQLPSAWLNDTTGNGLLVEVVAGLDAASWAVVGADMIPYWWTLTIPSRIGAGAAR